MSADWSPSSHEPVDGAATTMVEPCDRCDRETVHEVFVHVFVESADAANPAFSRQPYRVSVCTECGAETLSRSHAG